MIGIQPVTQSYHLVSERLFLVSQVLNSKGVDRRGECWGAKGSELGTGRIQRRQRH